MNFNVQRTHPLIFCVCVCVCMFRAQHSLFNEQPDQCFSFQTNSLSTQNPNSPSTQDNQRCDGGSISLTQSCQDQQQTKLPEQKSHRNPSFQSRLADVRSDVRLSIRMFVCLSVCQSSPHWFYIQLQVKQGTTQWLYQAFQFSFFSSSSSSFWFFKQNTAQLSSLAVVRLTGDCRVPEVPTGLFLHHRDHGELIIYLQPTFQEILQSSQHNPQRNV